MGQVPLPGFIDQHHSGSLVWANIASRTPAPSNGICPDSNRGCSEYREFRRSVGPLHARDRPLLRLLLTACNCHALRVLADTTKATDHDLREMYCAALYSCRKSYFTSYTPLLLRRDVPGPICLRATRCFPEKVFFVMVDVCFPPRRAPEQNERIINITFFPNGRFQVCACIHAVISVTNILVWTRATAIPPFLSDQQKKRNEPSRPWDSATAHTPGTFASCFTTLVCADPAPSVF